MMWSKEEPTVEGYYWHRTSKWTRILEVTRFLGMLRVEECGADGTEFEPLSDYHGEWYGPLEVPK